MKIDFTDFTDSNMATSQHGAHIQHSAAKIMLFLFSAQIKFVVEIHREMLIRKGIHFHFARNLLLNLETIRTKSNWAQNNTKIVRVSYEFYISSNDENIYMPWWMAIIGFDNCQNERGRWIRKHLHHEHEFTFILFKPAKNCRDNKMKRKNGLESKFLEWHLQQLVNNVNIKASDEFGEKWWLWSDVTKNLLLLVRNVRFKAYTFYVDVCTSRMA